MNDEEQLPPAPPAPPEFVKQIEDWTGAQAAKKGTTFGVKMIAAVAASPYAAQYLPLVGVTLSPTAAQKGLPIVIGILLHLIHDAIKKKYKVDWL